MMLLDIGVMGNTVFFFSAGFIIINGNQLKTQNDSKKILRNASFAGISVHSEYSWRRWQNHRLALHDVCSEVDRLADKDLVVGVLVLFLVVGNVRASMRRVHLPNDKAVFDTDAADVERLAFGRSATLDGSTGHPATRSRQPSQGVTVGDECLVVAVLRLDTIVRHVTGT